MRSSSTSTSRERRKTARSSTTRWSASATASRAASIVLRLNRFGRRTIGVLRDIAEIEEHGGVFISVEEKLDTSTATGRFVLRMFAALAELELDRIDEGWQVAHREHIKRGVSTGRTPAGYTKPVTSVKSGGRTEYGPLVPNEHADAIREAFRMKAEDKDMTWRQLAAFLTERGVPNQKGGPWSGNAARQLILNRVYLGEVRHNDHVNLTAHEPILKTEDGQPDERTFRLAGAKKRRVSGDRGNGHLLGGGLVRCGICGAGLVKTRSTVSETQIGVPPLPDARQGPSDDPGRGDRVSPRPRDAPAAEEDREDQRRAGPDGGARGDQLTA